MKDFLKHYVKEKKGNILNEKGEVIGGHDGAIFYTLGERHGFEIFTKTSEDKRYYIVAKDIKKNTLTVSQNPSLNSELSTNNLQLTNTNWISGIPEENKKYKAQIRYHGELLPCNIKCSTLGVEQKAEVIFENRPLVAPGQSIVIYNGDLCLGGGVLG